MTDILSDVSGTPFNVTASSTSLAPGNTQVADYLTGSTKVQGGKSTDFGST